MFSLYGNPTCTCFICCRKNITLAIENISKKVCSSVKPYQKWRGAAPLCPLGAPLCHLGDPLCQVGAPLCPFMSEMQVHVKQLMLNENKSL